MKKNANNQIQAKEKKRKFAHNMLKEIYEIPSAINNLLKRYYTKNKIIKTFPKDFFKHIKAIHFVGCGTAYHAGCVGKFLFEKFDFQSEAYIASELIYDKKQIDKNALYIFVSQSGETTDTINALKKVKNNGGKTLAVVNVENSSITAESDFVLYTFAGNELAIASTKAFNNQIALLYLLVFAILENTNLQNFKNYYKKGVSNIMQLFKLDFSSFELQAEKLAKKYVNTSKIYLIGRGFDFLLALEGALKLKEITYLPCQGYPTGELKHGPISSVDNNTLIICFNLQEKTKETNYGIVKEVKNKGAKTLIITKFKTTELEIADFVFVPKAEDIFMPLISIVPVQMLAYFLSLELGNNPDKPRYLSKAVIK